MLAKLMRMVAAQCAVFALVGLVSAPVMAKSHSGLDRSLPGESSSKSKKKSVEKTEEQAPAEDKRTGSVQLETTLADLGYKTGIQFDGVQSTHSSAVFFPVPRDVDLSSGRIRLHYRSSPLLHKLSNVRVYVNNTPRAAASLLADGDQVLDVPVSKADLLSKDGFIRVEFRVSMLFSDDRCLDERVNGGFLYIKPESSLSMTLSTSAASLRGAWDLLPREVKVSLPQGAITKEVFSAAWGLSEMLARENKKVRFVRLPDVGQVVIAPDGEMQSTFGVGTGSSNATLLSLNDGRRVIALSEPFDVEPFYFLSSKWIVLAAGSPYQVFPLEKEKAGGEPRYRLLLSSMGLNTETRQVDRLAEWDFAYSVDQMPAGYVPESLDLEVTAAPASDDHPAMFYVYFNNVLERAVRLENDGRSHAISVPIPKEGLSRHTSIRLVAQREYIEGDCHGDLPRFPMQVMPSSSLVVAKHSADEPKEFMGLSMYFKDGFDTYLPKSYLNRPEQVLEMLTKLVMDQSLAVNYKRINFYDAAAPVKPENPFLVIGRPVMDVKYAPVHFDKGHIQVVDGKEGNTMLDVDQLPGVVIAQLVKAGGSSGLQIAPGQEGNEILAHNFQFDHDDVAFVDAAGVLMTVNSHEPGGAKVYYPSAWSFKAFIDEYRYWLLFLIWVAMTAGVVFLFRRTRQNMPK
ncbi:MAG: cellulose biosynthesis cyclic di-GMP-binding regulatory protein BcsB [Nitrosomonadales bacterium]|nr:cellulose biosynthesis cyclic di-GMP-binding regulatory protein BcsB [Nitrosomonadales bacterium]